MTLSALNIESDISQANQPSIPCTDCSLLQLCIPQGIGYLDLQQLDKIIIHHDPINRGGHWFKAGDPFRSIFVVRSGCLKTYHVTKSGDEHICGFHFPGEIIGLDAIASGGYNFSAKALQTSSVCEIPFDKLKHVCDEIPAMHSQLMHIMSKEVYNDRILIATLGKTTAEGRIAAFLSNLSKRFAQRGFAANEFILGMSRNDIGNYLGLAVETVCRMFTRFQKENILSVNGKYIHIHKLDTIYALAGLDPYKN